MDYDLRPRRQRRRRQGLIALLMGIAAIGSVTTATLSMAFFGSTANAAGVFGTGSIALGVDASTTLTVTGMLPGDTINKPLQMDNTGTGALRYVLTSSTVGVDLKNLAPQIMLTVKTLVGADCDNNAAGVQLWPVLPTVSSPLNVSAHFGSLVSPFAGARTLTAGTHETLCFTAALPTSVGDPFQNATANVNFQFDAQQTLHNP
jgi:hypothetical protein